MPALFRVSSSRAILALVAAASSLIAVSAFPPSANAQDPALLDRMVELNRKALALHGAGKSEAARTTLMEAVVFGKEKGLGMHQAMARTYVHLGAIQMIGLKDHAKGVRFLELALKVRPDIQLTPSLTSPELEKAFISVGGKPRGAPLGAAKPVVAKTAPAKPDEKATDAQTSPAAASPPQPQGPASKPPSAAAVKPTGPQPGDEPELPKDVPSDVFCPVADEGPPDQELLIRCVLSEDIKADKVTLHHRQPGAEDFTKTPMTRTGKGWYVAKVPASATSGKSLQWFTEATGPGDKTWSAGKMELPNVIILRPGTKTSGHPRDDEAPFQTAAREKDLASQQALIHRRPGSTVFLGLSLGSGVGYHRSRKLELHKDLSVDPAFSPGKLGHVVPEVGYQWDDSLAVSLQARFQYIPESGSGDVVEGAAKSTAFAVLAKASYAVGTWSNSQVLASAVVGGGSGFRLSVAPQGKTLARSDTIRGGPILLGGGLGGIHHFTSHVAAVAEARVLVGAPDLAALVEINLGAQYGF